MITLNHFWQLLGWVAFALNVWGNWALTTKGVRGWIIRIACNLCWLPYGIYTAAWALLANHALFILINCYGWWKWRRDALADQIAGDVPKRGNVHLIRREAYRNGFDDGLRARRRRAS